MDPARGQFISQDPVFWSQKQNIANPQSLNSYSYADDNPISRSDPNGLSAKTGLQGLLSQLSSTLQALAVQLSQPQVVQYYQAARTGVTLASNPGAVWNSARSYVSSTGAALKTAGRSDSGDYLLGQRAGLLLPLMFGSLGAEGDAAALDGEISDAALVIRGGGLANQSAARLDVAIAKSAARGVNGFSVQCSNACTDISQAGMLGRYLPNPQLSVTTAQAVRQAGGDVVSTPSAFGSHATVTGLNGDAASQLPWQIINNPFQGR